MNKCLNCGKELTNKWQKKFCSRSCSAIFNNKKYPKRGEREIKYCKYCGKELTGNNRKNIFCNQNCHQNYKKEIYIERWKNGEESGARGKGDYQISKRVRNYLLENTDYKCELCGWGETNFYTGSIPLEIDHIDGNWKNNRPENLKVLCPNCHSLTETYRGANSGKGRGSDMRGSRLYK